jgi:hypothetical protein
MTSKGKKSIRFKIGEIVFLKSDCEQLPRIVTGILMRPYGFVYYLSNNTTETSHYEIEISKEENELIKLF